MFEKPFSFEGRIRRTEYGISIIIHSFLYLIIIGIAESSQEAGFIGLAFIPLLWFLWAQGAKRCHDLGNSGWWQLIPFYGLWMLFQDGQPYTNSYGSNPKGIDQGVAGHFGQSYIDSNIDNQKPQQEIREESIAVGSTLLEVQNASYGNVQDIIRQLRGISHVNQLSSEYLNTTGKVTIQHNGTSQKLLEELLAIRPDMEIIQVKNGHLIIRLK